MLYPASPDASSAARLRAVRRRVLVRAGLLFRAVRVVRARERTRGGGKRGCIKRVLTPLVQRASGLFFCRAYSKPTDVASGILWNGLLPRAVLVVQLLLIREAGAKRLCLLFGNRFA